MWKTYTYENLTENVFAYVCIKKSLWHQSDDYSDNIPGDFNFCVCSWPSFQISYDEHVVLANHAEIFIFVQVVAEVAEATSHI